MNEIKIVEKLEELFFPAVRQAYRFFERNGRLRIYWIVYSEKKHTLSLQFIKNALFSE